MRYSDALMMINTVKAMELMKYEIREQGAYIYFKCPQCPEQASIKCYSEKKNIWYCPNCRASGHIISLYMQHTGKEYREAAKHLVDGTALSTEPLTKELSFEYELQYHKFLEGKFKEETCRELGIGVPKGRTMMSGCVAFMVRWQFGWSMCINLQKLSKKRKPFEGEPKGVRAKEDGKSQCQPVIGWIRSPATAVPARKRADVNLVFHCERVERIFEDGKANDGQTNRCIHPRLRGEKTPDK